MIIRVRDCQELSLDAGKLSDGARSVPFKGLLTWEMEERSEGTNPMTTQMGAGTYTPLPPSDK